MYYNHAIIDKDVTFSIEGENIMTMKRRIFISNTIIVLISLLILYGVFGVLFVAFEDEYTNRLDQEYGLADHVYDVQTILMGAQNSSVTWEHLSEKIGEYGFTLYVLNENQEEFSNTDNYQVQAVTELEGVGYPSSQVKLYSVEGGTIARCIISKNGLNYHVYAVHAEKDISTFGISKGMYDVFIVVFVILGIIVIASLLFCSQFFTKKLIKKIMKPVEELNQAAKRINDGNLDIPITYQEKDEFLELCNTFNAMQKNLKSGMEKNASYEKARTDMISGISHDLRTPLTSVKGYVKGMLDGVANTPEKQKKYLEMSYKKACDMDELLQKLFFFSKLETGNMPIFMQSIELREWIKEYIEQKKMDCEEKGYSFKLEKEYEKCFVTIDIDQMRRVFDNLIENSQKYAEVSSLVITIKIEKMDKKIKIIFSDNGKGIDEDKLPHVFEQFYRGDLARTSKNDGSGLGLYVCKHIVEEHGGKINAKNDDGFVVEMEIPFTEGGSL
ncbi:MAG: HAMP domain-containing sensor histidine kinase [Lachnospiraceae bacterium]